MEILPGMSNERVDESTYSLFSTLGVTADRWVSPQGRTHTCDAAEEPQVGCGIPLVPVGHAFSRGRGHRNGHGDGLVELPPPWLHRHNGAKRCFVSEDFFHNFLWHGLSLRTERGTKYLK